MYSVGPFHFDATSLARKGFFPFYGGFGPHVFYRYVSLYRRFTMFIQTSLTAKPKQVLFCKSSFVLPHLQGQFR